MGTEVVVDEIGTVVLTTCLITGVTFGLISCTVLIICTLAGNLAGTCSTLVVFFGEVITVTETTIIVRYLKMNCLISQ